VTTALANGDRLLTIARSEIEKRAPLVFTKGAEGFEAADEADVTSPEKSTFILILDQRSDVIRAKGKLPWAAE